VLPENPSEDPRAYLLLAAQLAGAQAFRQARVVEAALRIGYEGETRPATRVLVELAAHRRIWDSDETGLEARDWLLGRSGRLTSRAEKVAPRGVYRELSAASHADPRVMLAMMDSDHVIDLTPRRTLHARAVLLVCSSALLDAAEAVMRRGGLDDEQYASALARLRAATDAGWRQLFEDRGYGPVAAGG